MLLLLVALVATAFEPIGTYPDCGEDRLDDCPSDFGKWEHISWIPAPSVGSVLEAELDLGAGIALDRALHHTGGRWDVRLAVLDSGVDWRVQSVTAKVLLNAAELPPPRDADGADIDDLDGNGILTTYDYADDPRVDIAAGRDAADDRLDPSDLIAAFSDGVDDDGNGYVDDIAGWDFFGGDNDPYPDLDSEYSDHGTGVLRNVGEAGDDGSGLGVCPNCALIPVRIGDTFITDGDRVALGIAYATDRGARGIGMAVGALTHPEAARQAVRYAESQGVVLVGAAGDENSYHHNWPAADDPVLYVHSVRGDNLNETGSGVLTYTAFFNCNNYGPRVDIVAPSTGCATGAVGSTTGAVGMVLSAAMDAGVDLTAAQVRALIEDSVDDVWHMPADAVDTWPSEAGWDAYYGYGRLNVGEAVRRVVAGEIPPTVTLRSPSWFAWPDADAPLVVDGTVDGQGVAWVVEVGEGLDPDDWTEVAHGQGPIDGVLAEVGLAPYGRRVFADLDRETAEDRLRRAHEAQVTVRVTATADGGVDVERRGVFVHRDPYVLPGFPMTLGTSLEGSAVLADMDGDGVLEIVIAGSDGRVHVLDGSGAEREGFPVRTGVHPQLALDAAAVVTGGVDAGTGEGVAAAPAVGDVDGDGAPDVVVATLSGGVYAWDAHGDAVSGFPVRIEGRAPEEFLPGRGWDNGIAGAPALGDVDGDGALEIVVAAMDQRLYVWDGAGGLLDGYPLALCQRCDLLGFRLISSPALGDLDGDGDLDAVIGSNEVPQGAAGLLFAVDLDAAEVLEGWPVSRPGLVSRIILPLFGEGHPASAALADLDGDGDLEVASAAVLGQGTVLHHDGSDALVPAWVADRYGEGSNVDDGAFFAFATNAAFGDADGDGTPDLFHAGSSVNYLVSLPGTSDRDFQHAIGGWSGATGDALPGFPRQIDDVSFLNGPSVADVSGDGVPEAIYGTGGYFVYAWDPEGTSAPGWPKLTGGWMIGGLAVGDVDGDGWLDVVATTREGWLFVWTTDGRADQPVQWASMFHDAANTGNYEVPLPIQEGPSAGCCRRSDRPRGGAEAGLLLPLLLIRRRRRNPAVGRTQTVLR